MATRCATRLVGIFVGFIALMSDFHVGASPIYKFNVTRDFIKPTDNNQRTVNLTRGLPIVYLGQAYTKFYISKDGLVSFGKPSQYRTQDWSAPDVSSYIDLPFIAPYHFKAFSLDLRGDYTGSVIMQELSPQMIASSNISQYIRSQVVGSGQFTADWVMAITWSNVTSDAQARGGRCMGTYSSPCPDDTFQLVLLTDGSESYAILNYASMDMPPERYDQAGFNGGHGLGWTDVLTSGDMRELARQQGSDTVGRYIFRISAGHVFRGGCSGNPQNTQLSIHPSYAGMNGGKMIDISGPCFTNTGNIMCRFGEQQQGGPTPPEVKAIYVSPSRVRCMVPRLLFRDRITLSLSLSGQRDYKYSAPLTIVDPHRMPAGEHVTPVVSQTSGHWYDKNPSTLTLTWACKLLTTNPNALVDIRLIGYKETNGKSEYRPLATLDTNVRCSSNSYKFNARDKQCVHEDCFNYEVGLLSVDLQERFVPNFYRSLSSKAIPLGWWVQTAMEGRHGSDWPHTLCMNWYNNDKTYTDWSQDLLSCPCTLGQSLADFGRWQPDTGCNLMNSGGRYNCFYHKEAVHCARSVQPVRGAGNQCCYGATGLLIFAQDTFQGSTPDRSHTWGAAPYGRPGHVPSLSHWLDDVVSFYYCCLWTGYDSCDRYMDLRPTKDCVGYSPPVAASVFGQGHVVPFAGPATSFRVVLPGDYVLLQAGTTVVQGRFRPNLFPTKNRVQIKEVYSLVGVAVQDQAGSDTVELNLRPPGNNTDRQKIEVKVNGDIVHFDDAALAWHDFNGVAVINTDDARSVQSNFTVILTNGIGLQVAEMANMLQVDVVVPTSTFSNVSGLFGDLNGTFTTQNGSEVDIVHLKTSFVNLYKMFELNWAVKNKSSSLFQDFTNSLVSNNPRQPTMVSPSALTHTTCGFDKLCAFDLRATGSVDIAHSTKLANMRVALLSAYVKPVRSCGLLNVPRSSKNNYNYTVGATTTITNCRVGSLSGPTQYTCQATSNQTQQWSPAVTTTCEEITEEANIGLIVGVTIAAIVGVVIIISIVVLVVRRSSSSSKTTRSRKRRADDTDSDEEREAMKTAV